MQIQLVVEGHGEIKAAPILVRRVAFEAEAFGVALAQPIRAHRSDFRDPAKIRRLVALARLNDPDAILILFDADDDCPVELVEQISNDAQNFSHPIPCEVVIANREFEAWFLAAIESIRGVRGLAADANFTGSPDASPDAKGQISSRMEPGRRYSPTADQAAITAQFDLAAAHQRSRSFRKMVKAVGAILTKAGHHIGEWPPPGWHEITTPL